MATARQRTRPARTAKKRTSERSKSSAAPAAGRRAKGRGAEKARVEGPSEAFRVVPVSAETWGDFEALFSARGSPHYCWCTVYRFRNSDRLSREQMHDGMHRLVRERTPIGVLAYEGGSAIGWCSAAPRESYVKLERSRTMPRVSPARTWTILCFFVQRAHRGRGVASALLAGALDEAGRRGAEVVEGYPHDTAGISATHRGTSKLFRALGFQRDGSRWFYAFGAKG
jgi:GNAT superfamily N-acetyltransferase